MFLDDVDRDLWFRFKILASHYPKQSGQPEGSATNPPGTRLWQPLSLAVPVDAAPAAACTNRSAATSAEVDHGGSWGGVS